MKDNPDLSDMLDGRPLLYLLVLLCGTSVDMQACTTGWFGEGCRFKCNCADVSLCDTDGTCRNNTPCKTGYFGPFCQYADLVSRYATNSTDSYLKDGDDATCNPDVGSTEVNVSLEREFVFTWFRIRIKDSYNMHKFTVELNEPAVQCRHNRKFAVSEMEVDITCDVSTRVNKIAIIGSIAPAICSVYVSGGRNVALKQDTWMSGTNQADLNGSASSNAVDGNSSADGASKSCAKTGDTVVPEWRLTYDTLYTIYYIIIYNRDVMQGRLKKFSLQLLDSDNQTVVNFQYSGPAKAVYFVNLDERTPVRSIRIVQRSSVARSYKMVTICEVETYGDVDCEHNRFGLICENACKCSSDEVCSQHTGLCSPGCFIGYYGRNCTLQCSKGCHNGVCNIDTGVCTSCVPGYIGDNCTTACPVGTYGQDCLFKCSQMCSHSCNRTNGYCHCSDNFAGPSCADCAEQYFGNHCNESCPLYCQICHRATGQCIKCLGRRLMPICADCPATLYGVGCDYQCPGTCLDGLCDSQEGHCLKCPRSWYGQMCRQKCSTMCRNDTCHINSGHCFSCQKGFHGHMCQKASTPGQNDWLAIVMMSFSMTVCILFIGCILKEKSDKSSDGEQFHFYSGDKRTRLLL